MTTTQLNSGSNQTLPRLEVANADFVTPFLAVGGDLSYEDDLAAAQAVEIAGAGITHALDVRQEWNDEELWAYVPEVTYRWDGIDDAGQQVPGEWFERIAAWALEAIEYGGVVLTHCHMGINRGPSAGFAVLLALGWEPVDALTAIRAARPIAAIGYAEDALRWHHARTGADLQRIRRDRARVRSWRRDNDLDVATIIRKLREEGA